MLKRSSKVFAISTETPNNKGFRVRTSGIDYSDYPKNPLLLWMHQRPSKENDFKMLPLGNGEEIELRDGTLYGRPCFDPSDPFAMQIYEKVENGTIRMASAGLLPLEWGLDQNEELWLERSKFVEFTLADIGSDPSALAVQLYDENDNLITLRDDYLAAVIPTPKPKSNMKLIQLSADVLCPLIGLAADAKPEEVQAKINELVTLSSTQKTKIETLTSEKATADAKLVELASEVDTLKKAAAAEKINGLVDGAIASKKITADQKDSYVKLAAADFDSTKSILDSMKANPSVKSAVEEAKATAGSEYEKLSWDEMDKSGKLIKLKAEFPEIFFAKYKAKYGTAHPLEK